MGDNKSVKTEGFLKFAAKHRNASREYADPSMYSLMRDLVFQKMLSKKDIKDCELLYSFVVTVEPMASAENSLMSQLKSLEKWDADGQRRRVIHALATFESAIAYFATLEAVEADKDDLIQSVEDICEAIEVINSYAIEIRMFKDLIVAERSANYHKKMYEDAKNEVCNLSIKISESEKKLLKNACDVAEDKVETITVGLLEHFRTARGYNSVSDFTEYRKNARQANAIVSYDNTEDD